jgi:RNA polymerase sigma factor (sigma-70 family)
VCEGAECGGFVKSTAKFGQSSYEHLLSEARRPLNLVNLGIVFAAIMTLKFLRPHKIICEDGSVVLRHFILARHNGRLLKHVWRGWFGDGYPKRWNRAASSYLDVRIDGKATNSFDLTSGQAAGRISDEAFDELSTRPTVKHEGSPCPLIFKEKPILGIFLFWLMAGLDAPLSDFGFFVGEPPSEKEPPRYIPSNVYWKRRPDGHKVGRLVSVDVLRVELPRVTSYLDECFRRVGQANQGKRPVVTERDKIILEHWPLIESKCKHVPMSERADAIQACAARLVKVHDKHWNPALGRLGAFAAQALEWEVQDFMKALRRQRPVERSINLNANNSADDDEDDNPQPEVSDMMRLNSLQTQATVAERRRVEERLGCVDSQRVIEQRLGLNGYQPLTQEQIAEQLGMSERQIRRIEEAAIERLREAVL